MGMERKRGRNELLRNTEKSEYRTTHQAVLKKKRRERKKKKEEMKTLKIIIPYCVTYNVMYHEGSN